MMLKDMKWHNNQNVSNLLILSLRLAFQFNGRHERRQSSGERVHLKTKINGHKKRMKYGIVKKNWINQNRTGYEQIRKIGKKIQ